jgi:hypothetical protein
MTSNQIVLRVVDALEQANIDYMIVGSYSSNVHGIPRSTKDADFVIALPPGASINHVADAIKPDLHLEPQMLFETVTGNYRYVITHLHSAFKVELFLLSADEHNQERFRRRAKQALDDREVWYQTAEDVIIQKLRWYERIKRSKDRDDVADVIDARRKLLDLPYIRSWCDRHGTRALFEEILASVPDV